MIISTNKQYPDHIFLSHCVYILINIQLIYIHALVKLPCVCFVIHTLLLFSVTNKTCIGSLTDMFCFGLKIKWWRYKDVYNKYFCGFVGMARCSSHTYLEAPQLFQLMLKWVNLFFKVMQRLLCHLTPNLSQSWWGSLLFWSSMGAYKRESMDS